MAWNKQSNTDFVRDIRVKQIFVAPLGRILDEKACCQEMVSRILVDKIPYKRPE